MTNNIYKPNLKAYTDAYNATSGNNQVETSEWFVFNPVDIYDTVDNKYLGLSEEDLANPEVLKNYMDDSRYAMLLGKDLNNPSGFMNISDYFKEAEIDFTKNESPIRHTYTEVGQYTDTGTGSANAQKANETQHTYTEVGQYTDTGTGSTNAQKANETQHTYTEVEQYTDTGTGSSSIESEINSTINPILDRAIWSVNIPVTFQGKDAKATKTPSDEIIIRLNDNTGEYRFTIENGKYVLKK